MLHVIIMEFDRDRDGDPYDSVVGAVLCTFLLLAVDDPRYR